MTYQRGRRKRYGTRQHNVGELKRQLDRAMSEDDLLLGICDALTFCGWRWMHLRRSDLAVVQGYQGFPDVVAARRGRLLFMELKTEIGKPSIEQIAWLDALQGEPGVEAIIVRPSTYDAALELIKRRP